MKKVDDANVKAETKTEPGPKPVPTHTHMSPAYIADRGPLPLERRQK
jgi:hypothetical protein